MIKYVNGDLHIIDELNRFGDPNNMMVSDLLASILAAAELCLTTDGGYTPDALNLIQLATLLLPSDEQFQAMGNTIADDDTDKTISAIFGPSPEASSEV